MHLCDERVEQLAEVVLAPMDVFDQEHRRPLLREIFHELDP